MSVPIRRALYGKMAGDNGLTSLLATPPPGASQSIWHAHVPERQKFPYVVFFKQAGTPRYALGGKAYDNELWTVKGVDRQDDIPDADPVDAIASRLDALLTDGSLSIAGGKILMYLRRETDVEYPEPVGDKILLHAGATFRLMYQ